MNFEREKHACVLKGFTKGAIQLLTSYDWPGNVRELRNFCERISILCKREYAEASDVLRALPSLSAGASPAPLPSPVQKNEREELQRILLLHQGNRKETARYLGIHPSTLWRKMKRLGLE